MEMVLKRQRELRKNGKKGFTLVELIVVIVILAILAAIAVPALTGYIDKARNSGLEAQARTAVVAVQTAASDLYKDASSTTDYSDPTKYKTAQGTAITTTGSAGWLVLVQSYAGSNYGTGLTISDVRVTNGTLSTLTITDTGGAKVDYKDGTYTFTPAP